MQSTMRPSDSGERELRIQELLDRWEHARESGDDVSAATLCETCPELRTELESRIRELRGIDGFIADTLPPDGTRAESSIDPREAEELHGAFGQFEILGLIAMGGMGSVYRARQRTPARIVALKVIKSGERSTSHEMRRFHAEAEAAAKLSHPGIVPVYEVGEQDGRHYFTMEFVEGRSLAQLVSEDGPLDSLRAAETMQSVAEAVQYAHERGIVHRDIKPANVLIDTNDRPRVTDFGIAKQLDLDTALTTTGQILGTPDFMSPEQARGNQGEIGTRSDIFSLGVTLYALLTGRSPFRGEDVYSTLRNVIEEAPASPRSANPQVARDLATICLKCLRKDPAERYASAQELADDLQSYLKDEPISARPMSRGERTWRWCRRNPLLAATGLTAFALLLVLAIGGPIMAVQQRDLADRADGEADRALDALEKEQAALVKEQAALRKERIVTTKLKSSLEKNEKAIYQFVQLTKDRRLLQDRRFRPVLKDFLKQALAYYQRFIADSKDDQGEVMRNRLGLALREVAEINSLQGSVEEAIKAHRQALSVFQSLAKEHPTNKQYQVAVAQSRLNAASLLRETGKPAEALEEVRIVLKIHERLAKSEPNAAEHRKKQAMCYTEIARVHQARGKPTEARKAYQRSRKILEQLVKDFPNVAEYQLGLGNIYSDMGMLFRAIGKTSEALKAYRQSLKISRKLVRDHPANTTYLTALANTQNNIGILLNMTGKPIDALAEYRQAAIIQEQLMREDPTVRRYQTGLASSLNNIAILSESMGKTNEALEAYHRALKIQERLVKENPTVTSLRTSLANSYYNLSQLYENTGKRDEAMVAGRNSLAIRQRLARDNPTSPDFQYYRALSLNSVGILYQQSGKPAEALKLHWECRAIWKRLAELNPKIVVYRNHLAVSYNNIGSVYLSQKRWTEAVASYQQALAIQRPLARAYPTALPYVIGLARMNFNISRGLMASNRLVDAILHLDRAVSQYERVRQKFPKSAFYKDAAMRSHWNRAKVHDALGQHRKAIRDWRLAAALGIMQYRVFFESQLCQSMARAGEHAEATNHAAALAKSLRDDDVLFGPILQGAVGATAIMKNLSHHADRRYDLACVYAMSADFAVRDAGLSATRRLSLSREYTRKAINLLDRVAKAGFFKTIQNRKRLAVDRDLDALRNRGDFQTLCRENGVRSYVVAPKPRRRRNVAHKP